MSWSPEHWRACPLRQDPGYPDEAAVKRAAAALSAKPGLARLAEVLDLKARLADVAAGNGFLLQGGDCGESFDDAPDSALSTCRLLGRMAETLETAAGPVVKVARLAGQYAKPRSEAFETRGGVTLPNYRGDIVNGIAFTQGDRTPDPQRMLRAYAHAERTMVAVRGAGEIFTSHEALLLPFEQAMAREQNGVWFSASAHFLWLGYRTRFPRGAHAGFLSGIINPIGVKLGPESSREDLIALLRLLNPANEPGKVTLICRFGAGAIAGALPGLVRAIEKEGFSVLWSCDPMHGNTVKNGEGLKLRRVADIRAEALDFVSIVCGEGANPAGIHLELTGEDVAECGETGVVNAARNHTHCDPRLNAGQSLELASALAAKLESRHAPAPRAVRQSA